MGRNQNTDNDQNTINEVRDAVGNLAQCRINPSQAIARIQGVLQEADRAPNQTTDNDQNTTAFIPFSGTPHRISDADLARMD